MCHTCFWWFLTNSLSCFHWLSSSTSMGVSMMPNRVQTYFSVYNTAPRASPENFISLSWKLVYFAACANSCLRSDKGTPPPYYRLLKVKLVDISTNLKVCSFRVTSACFSWASSFFVDAFLYECVFAWTRASSCFPTFFFNIQLAFLNRHIYIQVQWLPSYGVFNK